MARYLVGTSTLIDLSNDVQAVVQRFRALIVGGDELGISPIQITEFYASLPGPERDKSDNFISTFLYWPIRPVTAMRAGAYRYDLARRGLSISTTDAITAAVAWEEQATVVTDNGKDFPMPEVATLSLRDPR